MTHYNTLNVKLTDLQLNKLKFGIRNGTEVTFNLSSNMIGDYNDEINLSRKILLTDTQVSTVRKTFANNSSANIKLLKTQLTKVVQLGGCADSY